MDKKKINSGVKLHHYIYSLVIVLLVFILVYMFKMLKQLPTEIPIHVIETRNEINYQEPVSPPNDIFYINLIYVLIYCAFIQMSLILPTIIFKKEDIKKMEETVQTFAGKTYQIIYLLAAFVICIISLIKDSLTQSQQTIVVVFLVGTVSMPILLYILHWYNK